MLFGSYRWAERIFLIMSLAFFAYPVAMVLGHPDWGQVGSHLAIPHMEGSQAFVLLAVALIGTTVSPYMQFYAAAGVVDRGAKPEDYKLLRADAVLGAVFACLISLTIIIATAVRHWRNRAPAIRRPSRPSTRTGRRARRRTPLRVRPDRSFRTGRSRGSAVRQLRDR